MVANEVVCVVRGGKVMALGDVGSTSLDTIVVVGVVIIDDVVDLVVVVVVVMGADDDVSRASAGPIKSLVPLRCWIAV